eukprot:1188724-Prorocentrum_minimum.AAC.4
MQTGVDTDMQRVVRHLAGCSVGVVLAGGGNRGLAHLGAIRALQAAGIPIDAIGGTSEGAYMAALYAIDGGSQSMLERVRRHAEQVRSRCSDWSVVRIYPCFLRLIGPS